MLFSEHKFFLREKAEAGIYHSNIIENTPVLRDFSQRFIYAQKKIDKVGETP